MTGMEDLPDELLLEIFGHFSIRNRYDINLKTWEGAQKINSRVVALYKLSLVSRKLHRIVNPLLYSVLTRGGMADHRRRFLRTVIQRPDLGALVEEVRFSYFDWDAGVKGIPSEDADLREAAKLVDFGDDALNAAFQSVPAGEYTDTDVALLFNQLPNLKILEFEANETWFHTFKWLLSLVRRAAETGSGPLSSLRHLKATYGNENNSGFNPLFTQDWTALPALKSIEVVDAWSEERDGYRPMSLRPNKNIETLALWRSKPKLEFVMSALEAFGNLKAFHLSEGQMPGIGYLTGSRRRALLSALSVRQDTLEHITIAGDPKLESWHEETLHLPLSSCYSFKGFTLLKRLEISEHFLMGHPKPSHRSDLLVALDVFPPSLEVLRLGCCVRMQGGFSNVHRLEMFAVLLENSLTIVPNLRRIEILHYDDHLGDDETFDSLRALVCSFGIAFETIEWNVWKHEGLATAGVCWRG